MDTASQPTERIYELRPVESPPVAAPHHHGVATTLVAFGLCMVALFASAIALSIRFTEDDGVHLWAMVMMGALIIAILLGGVFLPFAREVRRRR